MTPFSPAGRPVGWSGLPSRIGFCILCKVCPTNPKMSCCGGGGSGRYYGRPYGPGFTTAGAVSCCGGGCAPSPCAAPTCATAALSTYYTGTPLTFTSAVSSLTLVPGLTATVVCPAAVSIVFSGTLQLQGVEGDADTTVDLTLQYYNTLLPSSVMGTVVPVRASLVALGGDAGPYVPVTASLDVTLPAGTYVLQVALACVTDVDLVVAASGTLNAVVTKSTAAC